MTANVAAKIGLCLLALSACSEVIEEKASVDYQPVEFIPALRLGFLPLTGARDAWAIF
jgi:hypothetical protein